jgi:Glycosyl hydrolase family 26
MGILLLICLFVSCAEAGVIRCAFLAPATSGNSSPDRPHTGELLGIFLGDVGESQTESFESALGRRVDISEVFAGGSDWQYMDSSNPDVAGSVAWLLNMWPPDRKLEVSLYLLPTSRKSKDYSLEEAAAGAYDGHYRHAAQLLAARDPNLIIRTGWEMNGNWMAWSACPDRLAYVRAFQDFVRVVRSVSTNFRIDWTPNIGEQNCAPDTAYPGDTYVDIVGEDIYEFHKFYSGRNSAQVWADDYNGPYGVKWWLEFARQHHKSISIPEWGTDVDDGYFVGQMIHLIKTNKVLYQSAWDLQSAPSALLNNPLNFALYRMAFGRNSARQSANRPRHKGESISSGAQTH